MTVVEREGNWSEAMISWRIFSFLFITRGISIKYESDNRGEEAI